MSCLSRQVLRYINFKYDTSLSKLSQKHIKGWTPNFKACLWPSLNSLCGLYFAVDKKQTLPLQL